MGCVTSYLGSSSSEGLSPTSEIHTKSLTSLPTTTIPTNVSTSDIASNTKARFGTCVNCSSPYISYNWCRNCAFPGKEKWTTGNTALDNFIIYTQEISPDYETYLEWIPYEKFTDIKEISKGGFSTIYEAIWTEGPKRNFDTSNRQWCRIGNIKVIMKSLHDSQQITEDFLNEIKKYYHCKNRENLIGYYGISQNPKTKEYILVTQFAINLDIRTFIFTKCSNINNSLTWNDKINILKSIAEIIKSLHNEKTPQGGKLFHGNLHPGNLLININQLSVLEESILLDLVSCWKPPTTLSSVQQQLKKSPSSSSSNNYYNNNNFLLYGVLPYIAPEILRGEKKSQSSDIYNFGMIMWELSTLSLPFFDRAHNLELAIEICEGVRPDPLPTTPEFYFDLMERCWDDDPSLRPNAAEIIRILDMNQLYLKYSEQTMKVVEHQEHSTTKTKLSKITKNVIKNTSFINTGGLRDVMRKKFKKDDFHKNIHSEAYYTSRIFDFSLNRLSVSSNSNNSFMAGTSDDFGEETGQSSLAISEMGLDDVIEISAIDYTLSKDSKGKKKA
ncbi:kinase-like protein [Rhizophagus irregularis]|uniref:Kinase-like protein n=1 Tax=Rhizophagus irregularis TaxID=588596 RepID=A0A2N0SGK4_9GLOM|nr:kinase-like protein [Rhizophagus irregularis]CAB4481638.1 unnamed protein product [Rhizophagus irregularis]